MTFALDRFDLDAFVRATLAEDLGDRGDVTSAAVIPADAVFAGIMQSREAIVVAGLPLAEAFFRRLDPGVETHCLVEDGDQVRIRNDRGGFLARAVVTDRARTSVVIAPSIWWSALTPDGRNANHTTPQALSDMGGGATFYDNLVEVEPI